MANAAQNKHIKHEAYVIETMTRAQEIADKLFGAQSNTFAVHEIYDYLADADEGEFVTDLTAVVASASKVHKTTSPTPEQVFGLFDKIWNDEE